MLKRFCHLVLSVTALALLTAVPSMAQRQTPGRPSLDFQALAGKGVGDVPFMATGGVISWSNYQFIGHTSLGAEFYIGQQDLVEPEIVYEGTVIAPELVHNLPRYDIGVGGGYFFRALATRNRVVILSFGITGYVGIGYCPQFANYIYTEDVNNKNYGKPYGTVGFLMSISPEMQFEVFPAKNFSLFLSARPRFVILNTLKGKNDWFVPSGGFGCKYYL